VLPALQRAQHAAPVRANCKIPVGERSRRSRTLWSAAACRRFQPKIRPRPVGVGLVAPASRRQFPERSRKSNEPARCRRHEGERTTQRLFAIGLPQDGAEGAFVDETRYRFDIGREGAIRFYSWRNFSYDVMSFLRFRSGAKRGEQIDALAGA
jgi:hypothetical protein